MWQYSQHSESRVALSATSSTTSSVVTRQEAADMSQSTLLGITHRSQVSATHNWDTYEWAKTSTHNWDELTHNWDELTHNWDELTHNWDELTHNWDTYEWAA